MFGIIRIMRGIPKKERAKFDKGSFRKKTAQKHLDADTKVHKHDTEWGERDGT